MTQKRHRKSGQEKQTPAKRAASPPGKPRRRRIVWISLAALIAAGGIAGFLCNRNREEPPPFPTISTGQLDLTSASLIEKHLDAVRSDPRSGAAWGKLGALLRSFEFTEEASRCLDAAEQFDKKEPRWPYLHGLLFVNSSPAKAIPRLRRAVELCGNDPEVPRLRLAKSLAESGEWDEAQRQLNELVRAKPDYAPASLALAHAALARGQLAEAVNQARRCTSDRRTSRAAWNLLSMAHQRLGETNAARDASRRVAALQSDSPVADPFEMEASATRSDPRDVSDRSQRLLQAGKLAEASALISQLVREHPGYSEGWLLLGRWQLLSNDPVAAEPSIRHHLELEPKSVNGFFQLGSALLAQKRFDDAAVAFQQAIQLKSDLGPAYYNLGFALARSGKIREALAPFREAIRHNPERIDSYLLLADLHAQLGEKAEARALLQQAEAIDASDPRLVTLRGKISRE